MNTEKDATAVVARETNPFYDDDFEPIELEAIEGGWSERLRRQQQILHEY